MIYDCFTFNNELDLLDLRLHELSSIVDKFVLVESTTTFSGQTKPLHYLQHRKRYAEFSDRIVHVIVDDMDSAIPADQFHYFKPKSFQLPHLQAWSREIHQRNAIERGLSDCRANDIIIIGDVDEIPDHRVIKKIALVKTPVSLEMSNYYYYLNCLGSDKITATKLLRYKYLEDLDPQEVRENNQYPVIPSAGWHFSYLGGLEIVKKKIESFAHQEHNTTQFKEHDALLLNISNGLDIFNRPFKFHFTKLDSTLPKYITSNLTKFKQYIYRDQADQNTLRLRDELFNSRSELYWKQLELESAIKTMNYYRRYSFPYIFAKIRKQLTSFKL